MVCLPFTTGRKIRKTDCNIDHQAEYVHTCTHSRTAVKMTLNNLFIPHTPANNQLYDGGSQSEAR